MAEEGKKRDVKPPMKHPKAELGRAAARSVAGAVPIAGTLIGEISDKILPDPEAEDRSRWEGEITSEVNSLSGRVDDLDDDPFRKAVTISGGAAVAAKFLAESCPDGMTQDYHTLEEMLEIDPELSKNELLEGLGDLESYGLIETAEFIGAPAEYRLTQAGYEALDPPIMGWSPEQDARKLAGLIACKRAEFSAMELEQETGWSKRRLNPALRIIADFVSLRSNEIQPHYVSPWFHPTNAEFARLRRFANDE